MYGAPTAVWKLFCEFEIFCDQIMERGLFIQMLGWKIGSGGASSVPPDSFLIGQAYIAVILVETPYCPFSSNENGDAVHEQQSGFLKRLFLAANWSSVGAPILAK